MVAQKDLLARGIAYNLTGSYWIKNSRGTSEGSVRFLPNRLFDGEVVDSQLGVLQRDTKQILGIRYRDGALGILKLPSNPDLVPVAWYLRQDGIRGEFAGKYKGFWVDAGRVDLDLIKLTVCEGLEKISMQEFGRRIFNREWIECQELIARRDGQCGQMTFQKTSGSPAFRVVLDQDSF